MFENIHQLDNDQLKKHFYPKKGWINDPNGLVYFNGYYHAFYQHLQNHEFSYNNMIKNDTADFEAMVWGHARSKDLVNWEEMPIALYADKKYDTDGVWRVRLSLKTADCMCFTQQFINQIKMLLEKKPYAWLILMME